MKKTVLIVTILLCGFFLYPEKVATLKDLSNPLVMQVDENQLYISDKANVLIYSLKNFKLRKKFGRAGEGPREFKIHPKMNLGSVTIDLSPDYIQVNSIGKFSLFTKNGKYLHEKRSISPMGSFRMLGEKYVGCNFVTYNGKSYKVTGIFDSTLQKVEKKLHGEKGWDFDGKKMDPFAARGGFFFIADNLIFIENEKKEIFVFDETGKKTSAIKPAIEPVKVTESYEKRYWDLIKNTPGTKDLYQVLRDKLHFPEYFPTFRYFYVSNGKICVFTWRMKAGKTGIYIYDLKGKLEKKVYIPLVEQNAIMFFPNAYGNGKIYQIVENEDAEAWDLHVYRI